MYETVCGILMILNSLVWGKGGVCVPIYIGFLFGGGLVGAAIGAESLSILLIFSLIIGGVARIATRGRDGWS